MIRLAPSLRGLGDYEILQMLKDGRAQVNQDTIVPVVSGASQPIELLFDGGSAINSANQATVGVSPLQIVPVGAKLVVCCGYANNAKTVTGVADNSTQAGTANTYTVDVSGNTSGSSVSSYICSSVITRSILTTDTVTVTFSVAAAVLKFISLMAFYGPTASGADTTANATSSSTAPDSGFTGTASLPDCLVVGSFFGGNTNLVINPGDDGRGHGMSMLHKTAATNAWGDEYCIHEDGANSFKATATLGGSEAWEACCAVYVAPRSNSAARKSVRSPLIRNLIYL